jgi:hypothetical protein
MIGEETNVMSDEKDDYSDLDEVLERAHNAALQAEAEGKSGWDFIVLPKVTVARTGVNPIMKRELGGTTLGRGAYGIPGDPMDRLLGQIAGLVPPDVEPTTVEPALAVVDPEVMRWTASAEDLAWMERAFSQKAPNGAATAPFSAKGELLYWYLQTLLQKIAAKGTIFAVLIALLKASPDDLSSFKMSNRKLAREAGVNLRRIPDAIRQLENLGVLNVVTEGRWSDLGPQAAVIPEYSLVPLEKIS